MNYLQSINHGFSSFLEQGDPRVQTWPLMQTPFPGWVLIAAYIYFVKVAGPKWMKRRQAFELRNIMLVYNFTMVFVNFYLFFMLGRYTWFNNYSFICQPVDYSDSYEAVTVAKLGWLFYVIKFVEFADTIFFVLRKKDKHVSALHVIHHSIVPFSLWFGIKFAPGGYNAFFPLLNSFVHVIMYSYYGLAALGPQFEKYLKWKKYITYIQMGQFVLVVLYAIEIFCIGDCEVSHTFLVLNILHALLFFALFYNFFRKSYGANFRKAIMSKTELSSEPSFGCSNCHHHQVNATDDHSSDCDTNSLSCEILKKEANYLKKYNHLVSNIKQRINNHQQCC